MYIVRVIAGATSWQVFGIGLAVRRVGLSFIWLGDGHDSVFRKTLVVIGVVLSVGGIGVLKYLLYKGLATRK